MSLYLVRHAKAGHRSQWDGNDRDRPLSKNGWTQADAIAARLAKRDPTALRSSPFLRCRQTLEPLAAMVDLVVVPDERLSEGASLHDVLELFDELADGAVLCTHGDVVPETIAGLQRRGCEIVNEPDWRKGTIWTLDRSPDGQFTRAKVWSPPPT